MTSEQPLSLAITIESPTSTTDELDVITRGLRMELEDLDPQIAFMAEENQPPQGAKAIDGSIPGLLVIAIGPTVLMKFLEFLHAWCMRREGQTISIEIQQGKDNTIKIQVPASMDRQEVNAWINNVQKSLKK